MVGAAALSMFTNSFGAKECFAPEVISISIRIAVRRTGLPSHSSNPRWKENSTFCPISPEHEGIQKASFMETCTDLGPPT